MNKTAKNVVATASSALMLASMGSAAVVATTADIVVADDGSAAAREATTESKAIAKKETVQGLFAFTQGEVSPIDDIAKHLGGAAKHLCGSTLGVAEESNVDVCSWTITINGAVENTIQATIEELIEEETETVVMGCSCASNPADGLASINAEVTGVSVAGLLRDAVPTENANTVVFTSADGYEIALPLDYLNQRYCPIVFDVNDSPLIDSVGGVNQLWLGSTSGHYFARDIVSITVEERETPPAAPGTEAAGDSYANLPNIGVYFGGEVA